MGSAARCQLWRRSRKKLALLWLQSPLLDIEQLLGRQLLAVTNLAVEPVVKLRIGSRTVLLPFLL